MVSAGTQVVTLPRSGLGFSETRLKQIIPMEVRTYPVHAAQSAQVAPLMAVRQPVDQLQLVRPAAGFGPAAVPMRRTNASAKIASPLQADHNAEALAEKKSPL